MIKLNIVELHVIFTDGHLSNVKRETSFVKTGFIIQGRMMKNSNQFDFKSKNFEATKQVDGDIRKMHIAFLDEFF